MADAATTTECAPLAPCWVTGSPSYTSVHVRGRFIAVLAIVAASVAVPSGTAQVPASLDLVLTTEVSHPTVETLVINDEVRFKFWVSSLEIAKPAFTLTVAFTMSTDLQKALHPAFVSWGAYGASCEYDDTPFGKVVLTCPSDSDLSGLWLGFKARAPGLFAVNVTLSGPEPDPDLSNNSFSWQTTIVCSINGTAGDDELVATDAVDSICGGDGDDRLTSVGSDDWLFGEAGDDTFSGGLGSGDAVGGEGFDTVTYANADRRIHLCRENALYAVNLDGWSPNALTGIERFIGSPYGDFMEGTSGPDLLLGGGGWDRIMGIGGADRLYGGNGRDRFVTRDRKPDLIRGGLDRDRVQADTRDTVQSATRVASKPFDNLCNT